MVVKFFPTPHIHPTAKVSEEVKN